MLHPNGGGSRVAKRDAKARWKSLTPCDRVCRPRIIRGFNSRVKCPVTWRKIHPRYFATLLRQIREGRGINGKIKPGICVYIYRIYTNVRIWKSGDNENVQKQITVLSVFRHFFLFPWISFRSIVSTRSPGRGYTAPLHARSTRAASAKLTFLLRYERASDIVSRRTNNEIALRFEAVISVRRYICNIFIISRSIILSRRNPPLVFFTFLQHPTKIATAKAATVSQGDARGEHSIIAWAILQSLAVIRTLDVNSYRCS